jgi:centromeric protein E
MQQVIESRAYSDGTSTPAGKKGEKMTRISTLSIIGMSASFTSPKESANKIDLAGSERHTTSKERNAEGKHINQS